MVFFFSSSTCEGVFHSEKKKRKLFPLSTLSKFIQSVAQRLLSLESSYLSGNLIIILGERAGGLGSMNLSIGFHSRIRLTPEELEFSALLFVA
jgi:hypothetical protein